MQLFRYRASISCLILLDPLWYRTNRQIRMNLNKKQFTGKNYATIMREPIFGGGDRPCSAAGVGDLHNIQGV